MKNNKNGMRCNKCKLPIEDDIEFCGYCDAQITANIKCPEKKSLKENMRAVIYVVAFGITFTFIVPIPVIGTLIGIIVGLVKAKMDRNKSFF